MPESIWIHPRIREVKNVLRVEVNPWIISLLLWDENSGMLVNIMVVSENKINNYSNAYTIVLLNPCQNVLIWSHTKWHVGGLWRFLLQWSFELCCQLLARELGFAPLNDRAVPWFWHRRGVQNRWKGRGWLPSEEKRGEVRWGCLLRLRVYCVLVDHSCDCDES